MTTEAWNAGKLPEGARVVAVPNTSDPSFRYENRIAELIVALEDARRLLAFAGCPTDWIGKVLRGNAGVPETPVVGASGSDWMAVGTVTSMVKGGVTWQTWPDQLRDGATLYAKRAVGVTEAPDQRELNDKIDAWHNGAGDGKPLHEFLGMTREEFARRVAGAHGVGGPEHG